MRLFTKCRAAGTGMKPADNAGSRRPKLSQKPETTSARTLMPRTFAKDVHST